MISSGQVYTAYILRFLSVYMQKTCAHEWCKKSFEITNDDLAFYEKVSPVFSGKKKLIPAPTLCPECRMQRRMLWRNERTIYRRKCDLCSKMIIAQYPANAGYIVYCNDCYWGDRWSAIDFGQTFETSRTFFAQFADLLQKVPLIALINTQAENSDYCHRIFDGRNCYLSFIALYKPEDLLYSYYTITCKNCTDISMNQYCELCFETVDAERCYGCRYGQRIRNCRDCAFLEDCNGCSDCFGCKNLNQKQYCIFNEQKTRSEYENFLQKSRFGSWEWTQGMLDRTHKFFLGFPYRSVVQVNAENCTGSYIFNSRFCDHCFDTYESEYIKNCAQFEKSQWCQDVCGMGAGSFSYEGVSLGNDPFTNLLFCASVFNGGSDLLYCYECYSSCHHCFGCIGLRHSSYCIFNKQYSKQEYERLVPEIITTMQRNKEYGEFFPGEICPFSYNETAAQENYPLTNDEVSGRGWKWRDQIDDMPKANRLILASELLDEITDVSDDILDSPVQCKLTQRPFRIIHQELEYYRRHNLPLPRLHPDERHLRRMASRNPRKLWNRTCAKCQKPIATSYSPDRPEIVYCESCYLETVY